MTMNATDTLEHKLGLAVAYIRAMADEGDEEAICVLLMLNLDDEGNDDE
jgi:hypothetical protein